VATAWDGANTVRRSMIRRILERIGISPGAWSVWFFTSPFKIYEFISVVEGINLRAHHTVLDFGCGKGRQTQLLAKKCKSIVGIDVNERKIATANRFLKFSMHRRRKTFMCRDIEEAGLPSNHFDYIISFCVLEHVENLDEVMREFVRILKPGGQIHVSVDSLATIKDASIVERHKTINAVIQYFDAETLNQVFERSGLHVEEIAPIRRGEFARQEFEKRIATGYKGAIFKRIRDYKRLGTEDKNMDSKEGLFIIGRATKPL